jgi:glycosyltransferase involved in cell wall biosynthesis
MGAVVITLNEEAAIEGCLQSLSLADEIIVVDSGSTDDTRSIAQRMGALVIVQPWLGYSEQRNFGLSAITSDWVLYLDADERLSIEALRQLRNAIDEAPDDVTAFALDSDEYFLGDFLRHGGFGPGQTNWKVRAWRRGSGAFHGDVHERLLLDRGRPAMALWKLPCA